MLECYCSRKQRIIYIYGDFNFDLLKIDSDHVTQHFFNLLCNFGLLPHVLQPSRVTDNTATVVDNIFSNNIQDNIVFGNILLTLSEHFSQFLSITREKVDLKKANIYRMIVFVMMSQFQIGITTTIMFMTHLATSI